jgi:hypothetical protein
MPLDRLSVQLRGVATTQVLTLRFNSHGISTVQLRISSDRRRMIDSRSLSNGRCVPRPDDPRILLVNRIGSSMRSVRHGSSITESETLWGSTEYPLDVTGAFRTAMAVRIPGGAPPERSGTLPVPGAIRVRRHAHYRKRSGTGAVRGQGMSALRRCIDFRGSDGSGRAPLRSDRMNISAISTRVPELNRGLKLTEAVIAGGGQPLWRGERWVASTRSGLLYSRLPPTRTPGSSSSVCS